MLVLTRKAGEKIQIGDSITLQIMDVKGRQVRIGIVAPDDIKIHREEIYRRIKDQNIAAAAVDPQELEKVTRLLED